MLYTGMVDHGDLCQSMLDLRKPQNNVIPVCKPKYVIACLYFAFKVAL